MKSSLQSSSTTSAHGITDQQASDIEANNLKVGLTTDQSSDIANNKSLLSAILGSSDADKDSFSEIQIQAWCDIVK